MIELDMVMTIDAPVQRCFDLSRSIEVHLLGNTHFGEQATAGISSGLIGLGEQVTWRAKHFGVRQKLTSAITRYDPPGYFQDTMLRGAFKSMQHDHYFCEVDGKTEMRDVFRFSAPLRPLGWIAERVVLRRYMEALLQERNDVVKRVAESGEWRRYLGESSEIEQ